MNINILKRCAKLTGFVFLANTLLIPFAHAQDAAFKLARTKAREGMQFMHASGALSSAWSDQRKQMETLKQRVKDSRLDLDNNGIGFYRKKADVMVDLERQRMRRAVRFLLDNNHASRMAQDLKRSGHRELTELANNLEMANTHSFAGDDSRDQAQSVADTYLSYRFKGYQQVVNKLETKELRQVMVDTESAADEYVKTGGSLKALNRGIFAGQAQGKDEGSKNKIIRWLIGAIAGIGLIIAVFFAFTTMTITPFLAFVATVSGLVALLSKTSQFQSMFYGNPYGPTPGNFSPYNPYNPYAQGQFGAGMGGGMMGG